jgi:putative cell wall-binding protein
VADRAPCPRWGRLQALLLVMALLAGLLPATVDALLGAPAHAESVAVVHTPLPAPGAVVPSGTLEVGARVTGSASGGMRLTVNNRPASSLVIERVPGSDDRVVRTTVDLAPGEHTARLEVLDGPGRPVAQRTWRFRVTAARAARLAGPGRFETAVAASRSAFPAAGSAGGAVLARGDDFADALAGAPLAAAVGGPLLLSSPSGVPRATADELRRVLPAGAPVHLLGGTSALGPEVAEAVTELGFVPVRVAGTDRFDTAAEVARLLPPAPAAVVASGASFPDALAASAPAARDRMPVLLATSDTLPGATAAVLAEREVAEVAVIGGTGVIGAEVERELARRVARVRRIAGGDRHATAAAVLRAFYAQAPGVSLASGATFADALAGAPHAAASAQPLLLTARGTLPPATADALREAVPRSVWVYGGSGVVGGAVVTAALRAATEGPAAPRVTAVTPAPGSTVRHLEQVEVHLDRAVDASRSSVYVEVGGAELRGGLAEAGATRTLTLRIDPGQRLPAPEVQHLGRIVVAAAGPEATGHHESTFAYLRPDPLYAEADGVVFHLPSTDVELIGYHESGHPGARQQTVRRTSTPSMTLPSRGRGTGSRTSADVVANPDLPVVAPVTGRVLRASSYVLYCRYGDEHVVIAPDARPSWEVKVLHVRGVSVRPGDRVVAGLTRIAAAPRIFPFASQVDRYSQPRSWPHVHVELVDPSVPPRPGSGC